MGAKHTQRMGLRAMWGEEEGKLSYVEWLENLYTEMVEEADVFLDRWDKWENHLPDVGGLRAAIAKARGAKGGER